MQKVIRVGNSLAVTLDNKYIQQTGIKVGQELAVSYKPDKAIVSMAKTSSELGGNSVVAEEKAAYLTGKVTPEFQLWVEKSLDEDAEAMRRLADL